jgi:hypothetical protein
MSTDAQLRAALAADAPPAQDALFRLRVLRAAAQRRARQALWRRCGLVSAAGLALISISPQLAAMGEPLAILGLTGASLWAARQFVRAVV